ncbi:hypothetical protein [Sphingomonas sp.]|uniref:hypothetical protein n=1 Tax=Sphingomonas sp. TaxID=28214 RepID=UPI0026310929|nr:hypothetical protein [Sphingomonas sp.]MDF2496105.1 hypothetical protein [Sphingomonas sp.]
MTAENTEIVRRHVEAATQMLLGNGTLRPGAMIIAGETDGGEGRLALAHMAKASGKDVIFLAFKETEGGYRLIDMMIAAVRSGICHLQTGCQLYLSKAGARAVILPQAHVRGHFRLSPGELVHLNRKPADIADGIRRAGARLARLTQCGVELNGRVVITTYPARASEEQSTSIADA